MAFRRRRDKSVTKSLSRGRLDRRAIGAAGESRILHLAIGVEFMRQNPADDEKANDDAERDQGTAAAVVVIIGLRHAGR